MRRPRIELILECGGRRSATPFWMGGLDGRVESIQSAVAASLCQRTPHFALPAHSKIATALQMMPQSPELYIPQTTGDRRPLIVWGGLVLLVTGLLASIIAAPLALANNHAFFALAIYQGFSHLCHQIPERSFFIAGHQFAVCARCTGLYAGFAAAVIAYPLFGPLGRRATPHRRWLFLAAAPMAIDFSLGFLGIWENTHWSRFATGALLGAVAALYVVPGLVDLSYSKLISRSMEISRG